jgi:hypothetical protein
MKKRQQIGLLAAVWLATIAGSVQAKSLLPGSVCFAKNDVDRAYIKFNEDNYLPTPTGRRGIINGGGFSVPVVCPYLLSIYLFQVDYRPRHMVLFQLGLMRDYRLYR